MMKPRPTLIILVIALGLLWASGAYAQVTPLGPPNLPPSNFDVTGFIQEATLDGTVAGKAAVPLANTNPLAGGTITINGIKILVPNKSIVQMPATSFNWAQLFDPAVSHSVGYAPPRPNHRAGITGLALADNPLQGTRAVTAAGGIPYPSYEARVVGNVVYDPATGTQNYIAALIVPATQQGFNAGSGIINFIDYVHGRFRVGGIIGNPLSGTLCEINDPVSAPDGAGRFGLRHSPDPRFTSDTNNPTITTSTGYPCGLPRVAPTSIPIPAGQIGDPTRPYTQRPKNGDPLFPTDPFLPLGSLLKTYFMGALPVPAGAPDPRLQVPMMVGDYVSYSGTLFKINPLGPNTAANMFVSVHTLELDLGVYTANGSTPVYIKCDVALIGTDGLDGPVDNPIIVGGVTLPGEFARRATFEGFCTDAGVSFADAFGPAPPKFGPPAFNVTTNGVVVDAAGNESLVPVPDDTNPALGKGNPSLIEGLPLGRYVFRAAKLQLTTLPLTREYRVVHSNGIYPQQVCNGLTAGQFQLPCFDYVTPEHTTQGSPQYPGNYQDLPFLLNGNIAGGTPMGPLDPWPGRLPDNQPPL